MTRDQMSCQQENTQALSQVGGVRQNQQGGRMRGKTAAQRGQGLAMQARSRAPQHAGHVVEHGVGLRLVLKQLHVGVEEVALGHVDLQGGGERMRGGGQERIREEGGEQERMREEGGEQERMREEGGGEG